MSKQQEYEQIERYLDKQMSVEERARFEARLAQEEALRQEVQLQRELAEVLAGEEVHELRTRIKEVDEVWKASSGRPSKPSRSIFSIRSIIGIAALLAIGIFTYTFLQPGTKDASELYAQHYEPYQLLLEDRSTSPGQPNAQDLQQAIRAYQQANYPEAARLFAALQQQAPDNPTYAFYAALCALSTGQSQQAIDELSRLQSGDHLLVEQSRWYLALAHLQAENVTAAKAVLSQIENGQYKYQQAQRLLKEWE
ncbi:MAG: hypothetical protein AAFV95_07060 [Bacteroidota bacterium]